MSAEELLKKTVMVDEDEDWSYGDSLLLLLLLLLPPRLRAFPVWLLLLVVRFELPVGSAVLLLAWSDALRLESEEECGGSAGDGAALDGTEDASSSSCGRPGYI